MKKKFKDVKVGEKFRREEYQPGVWDKKIDDVPGRRLKTLNWEDPVDGFRGFLSDDTEVEVEG